MTIQSRSSLVLILKVQLQTKLQLPHVDSRAGVCYLAEGARSGDHKAVGRELVGSQEIVGIPEVGVIGAIEAFEPELQVAPLGDIEVLERGEVPTGNSRAEKDVPLGIAVSKLRLQFERPNVEPLVRSRV